MCVAWFALALASCGSSCPPFPSCLDASNCEGRDWPEDRCPESAGRWECQNNDCVAVCESCVSVADCLDDEWTLDCGGRFICNDGACTQACDGERCGDGFCDETVGESRGSCPEDCQQPCTIPGNCLMEEWDLPCEGRWDCVEEVCVPICDYDACGDGTCSPGNGENAQTCPQDCREGCELPPDCYGETWDQICQGRWNCIGGECDSVCDETGCGNGTCEGLNGENQDSCFQDCQGGPCDVTTDCVGYDWVGRDCSGHWECVAPAMATMGSTGACEAVCDISGCGDGDCDILGGETPKSCGGDCGDYICSVNDDCTELTLPAGCSSWLCSAQVCVPQCE